MFDKEIVIGGVMDLKRNRFTAPRNGYFFTFTGSYQVETEYDVPIPIVCLRGLETEVVAPFHQSVKLIWLITGSLFLQAISYIKTGDETQLELGFS